MPRSGTHTLAWSSAENRYLISSASSDLGASSFEPDLYGEAKWSGWLASHNSLKSLVFQGRNGHLNLLKEARTRGGAYWYAYSYNTQRTLKRYLGASSQLTLARLEDLAGELANSKPVKILATTPASPNQLFSNPPQILTSKVEPRPASLTMPEQPIENQSQILLVTKLSPPVLPGSIVPRARLMAALEAATARPFSLVCATAGWGKTTLLAEWATSKAAVTTIPTLPVAWLSLDKLDDDLTLFWISIIAALRRVVPNLGDTALGMLRSSQPASPTSVLTALLNELAGLEKISGPTPNPLILVLDDYQLIQNPAIHESLVFWIEHSPVNMRLVIATRLDPPFPLSKWRVKGLLAEIRVNELGFMLEESGLYLMNNARLTLSQEEISTLANRTQGWVAGLQLAALSLEKQSEADKPFWIANFTGNNRYLLDYIEEEVLSQQPEEVQQFLLYTAVLTRLNAQVCQAVSGEENSLEFLNSLERNNLFIIPLDDRREWYRYHDLFREVLLARLHMKRPELVRDLHTRATHWYTEHHEPHEAIAHAFAASNFALAAEFIEQAAKQLWLNGQQQAVFNWVELLPDDVLKDYVLFALEAGRRLVNLLHFTTQALFVKAFVQVDQLLGRLEQIIFKPDKEKETIEVAVQLMAERLVIRRRIGLLRALVTARTYLNNHDAGGLKQLLENVRGLGDDEDLNWRLVEVSLSFWLTESLERRGAIMIPQLLELKEQAIEQGNKSALLTIQSRLAFAYCGAGQVRRSAQECEEGLALLRRTGELSISEAYFHLFRSDFFIERYRLEEAKQELLEALRVAHLWQWLDLLVDGYVWVAAIEIVQNKLAAANLTLQQAEEIAHKEQLPIVSDSVIAQRVRYWLANGELNRARQWAETTEFSIQKWNYNQIDALLAQVQVFMKLGRYRQAVAILDRFNSLLDRPTETVSWTISFLATYFVALHLAGKTTQAQTVALKLFALTAPEELMWSYITGGAPMRQALQSLLDASKSDNNKLDKEPEFSRSYVEGLIEALKRFQISRKTSVNSDSFSGSLLGGSETRVSPPHNTSPLANADFSAGSGEELSPHEQRVMRLLVGGCTYGEIAEELVVSHNTIKTQVNSIYRKLGVSRRSELVELVRHRQVE